MSAKAFPTVPPRPSRSPNALSPPSADMPKIPPRPTSRRVDRSVSPGRYAPSPLNDLPAGSGRRAHSRDASASNLPARPPSVTLPSVGQEGMEYADLEYQNGGQAEDQDQQPTESRTVNRDLYLHAPRPSLPKSSAKAQVQTVTRTDSQQAAAAGFGKAVSHDEEHSRNRSAVTNGSRRASSTASSGRRASLHLTEDGGIPEIGQQVPMYPNAGDVQAPSPSPYGDGSFPRDAHHSAGGQQRTGRHHSRTKSGRESSLPPGSYGLHGHGVQPNDKFEKAWYDKHPDELAREAQGQYGPGLGNQRAEWAMSSDDLNKIVRTSGSRGVGLATHADVMGTPEEEVGYIATDELASRLASPPIGSRLPRDESGLSQGTVESPLKQSVVAGSSDTEHDGSKPGGHEKEEVIHIDEPLHHQHHPDGFAPAPDEEHKPHGAHPLEETEEGPDDVPVLAPDEVEPGAEYMQPAVSPTFDRRGSGYHAHELDSPSRKNHRRSPSAPSSRPTSRPVSTHGTVPSMTRFSSRGDEREDVHTTLENVEEYEPLFPEDEEKERRPSPADRFNKSRPQQHRFPSQDIWEDTPDSLQLEATVSTPEIPSRPIDGEGKTPFETLEQEAFRSRHAISPRKDSPSKELQSHLDDEKPPRPDSKQRFPSKDIWEDAPDSQQLVATVQIPEEETKPDSPVTSPVTSTKPAFPAIPARPSKPANQRSPELKATSPTDSRKPPTIPSRPKPQIPTRPAKPSSRTSEESLTKTTSAGSTEGPAPPLVKAKPAIPSRPGGSKIAALKAGFLSDLDQRLKLGPQGPKPAQEKKSEAEEPAEKAPLSDARKGRAKGPARRKPAVAAAPEPAKLPVIPEIRIVDPWNVWQVGGDGVLVVGDAAAKPEPAEPSPTTPKPAVAEPVVGAGETEEAPARDSSSSPSRNAEPTSSSSSRDDPAASAEGEAEAEAETETEAEPKGVSPVTKEPEPAATASIPDEKVEQTTVDDVEKKTEEASGDS